MQSTIKAFGYAWELFKANKSNEPPLDLRKLKLALPYSRGVAQWVRAFAPQAEGWVFESQPRQTQVVTRAMPTWHNASLDFHKGRHILKGVLS